MTSAPLNVSTPEKKPLAVAYEVCLEVAARVWCDPAFSHVTMNIDAARKIAEILQDVSNEVGAASKMFAIDSLRLHVGADATDFEAKIILFKGKEDPAKSFLLRNKSGNIELLKLD